ncbi:10 kDa chaperonin 1, chloroplastic-like [Silene latifolia]|uniref:10 kDa chaperonin 1, chloroplastic-like n=1 Tax=Silene latifolia TaxID=37657 RepID=UPI003D76EF3E
MASTTSFFTLSKSISLPTSSFPRNSNFTLLGKTPQSFKINAVAVKWEPSKVVPQADRVLIRLEDLPEKSAGGVLLPKSAVKFERYLMGEVLSVGSEVVEVETGKKVLFSDISAYEVDLGTDSRHLFCKESDLLAVVE